MDFKELFRVMRRRWKTIAVMLTIALAASTVLSLVAQKQYQSTASFFVTADTKSITEAYGGQFVVQGKVKSYAALATHREVLQAVINDLDLPLSPDQVAGKISAVVETDTVIIDITATDGDPRLAQALARVHSEQLVSFLEEVETPKGQDTSQIKATITDPATFNPNPVSPNVPLNLVLAGLIGLMLGVGLALVRELIDNSVKTNEHVEQATGTPVMATIGLDKAMSKQPLLTDVKGFSPRGEAFRMLRTNLQYLDLDNQPKSLVITSAVAGEGKTTTSTNLAVALAQAGRRVLLIDGDLRRPKIAELLGLESSVGLTTVLVGRTKLEESIQRHAPSGVYFLAGGPTPPNPTEILQSHATHDLLVRLREAYDAVIIDAPPLLPVADAAILGTAADGVILVSRYGQTPRDELEAAAKRLVKVGVKLYGVVVNMIPRRANEGYYYYYYDDTDTGGARRKSTTEVKSKA